MASIPANEPPAISHGSRSRLGPATCGGTTPDGRPHRGQKREAGPTTPPHEGHDALNGGVTLDNLANWRGRDSSASEPK